VTEPGISSKLMKLKYIARCDELKLPESTDPEFEFEYVDVSAVSQGRMNLHGKLMTFGDSPSRARRLARPGDTVISTIRTYLKAVAQVPVVPYPLVFSTGLSVLSPKSGVNPRWLSYAIQSQRFIDEVGAQSVGVSYPAIAPQALTSIKLSVPAPAAQCRIADFLDRETARIDTLIEKQEKLIETLRERRAALFDATLIGATNAVGTRFKHFVLGVRQGWSPQCHPWPTDGIEHWAVLKTGCANGGLFRPQENKELPDSEVPRPDTVVQQEEIIVSRANTRELVGSAAVVGGEFPKLMLSDKLYSFQVDKKRALPQFLAAVLGTRRVRDFIELEATGSSPSMLNVSREEILNLPVELPDIQTQHRLWCELSGRREKIDALITKAQKFIKLAKERRSALITAAVTGRIDVTEDAGG